jgi:hypothetical protein
MIQPLICDIYTYPSSKFFTYFIPESQNVLAETRTATSHPTTAPVLIRWARLRCVVGAETEV